MMAYIEVDDDMDEILKVAPVQYVLGPVYFVTTQFSHSCNIWPSFN
jgi:hypothetical protein